MYLYARKFLWHSDTEEGKKIVEAMQGLFPEIGGEPKYVEFEVMYWCKANAIHNWFVENVQKGNDDCGSYEVSWEQLQRLHDVLEQALGKPAQLQLSGAGKKIGMSQKRAKELLPTTEGFFFGGTDYDEHYWKELELTRNVFANLLNKRKQLDTGLSGWTFTYHSSW